MSVADTLKEACTAAGFTQQDMATWLQYDYSTIQAWLTRGTQPLPLKQKHIDERLKLLYDVLQQPRSRLPVPPYVTQYERKTYIEGVRDHALGRISGEDSSGAGV